MRTLYIHLIILLFLFPVLAAAQNNKEHLPPVQFEHLRINVADKEATARWYVENLGLEIIPSDNDQFIYLADKDHNFMLELSSIPGLKNTYQDVSIDAFHLAFEGLHSIDEVAERMLKNGGTQEGELYTNKLGDYVMNVRDPNGFTCQLIHRVNPFLSQPKKSNIRFEHFAFNTTNQKTAALWYVEFMDLVIPWSKDIDKSDLTRNYRVPYVGDEGNHMSLELFGKDVENTLANQPHEVIHIAFLSDEPEKLAERLEYGGATLAGEPRYNKNGDLIIDLYDPNQTPLRIINRQKLILH